jgi:hypothetical protein
MRIVELLILHFGIAASMAAGFALLPLFFAAVMRVLRRPPRPTISTYSAAQRLEQLRLLAALQERRT